MKIPGVAPFPCFTIQKDQWERGMVLDSGESCDSAYISKPDNAILPSEETSNPYGPTALVCVRVRLHHGEKMGLNPLQELLAKHPQANGGTECVYYFLCVGEARIVFQDMGFVYIHIRKDSGFDLTIRNQPITHTSSQSLTPRPRIRQAWAGASQTGLMPSPRNFF